MHTKDRSQIAYLVVKDAVGGVYQSGDHFHSELLNIDQAKQYLDAGTIVELEPGDDPAEVFEAKRPGKRPRVVAEPAEPEPVASAEPDTKPAPAKAEKASK